MKDRWKQEGVILLHDALIKLVEHLGENIIEITDWRIVSDMAIYTIDTDYYSYFAYRDGKDGRHTMIFSADVIHYFGWDGLGYHQLGELDPEKIDELVLKSWTNITEHMNEKLIGDLHVPYGSLNDDLQRQVAYLAYRLNKMVPNMLDEYLVANPKPSEVSYKKKLDQDCYYESVFYDWQKEDWAIFNHKWGKVLKGLQIETYLVLKEPLKATLTKKGKRYLYALECPYQVSGVTTIYEFLEKDELKQKCGYYFKEDGLKDKVYTFNAKWNAMYYRISDGLLFSTPSIAYQAWKCEGEAREDDIFKVMEAKK